MKWFPMLLLSSYIGLMTCCFHASRWQTEFERVKCFRNFSQSYQDCTLQSLFDRMHLGSTNQYYVEFGFHLNDVLGTAKFGQPRKRHPRPGEIPPYGGNTELLRRQGWTGLRMDGHEHINKDPVIYKEFITPQNVAHLFQKYKVPIEPDYVSIDIDSCDLWVFLALTDAYRPRVISIEYNSNYAFEESKTNVCVRPDDAKEPFFTSKGHIGDGASFMAIHKAARRRGYEVVWVDAYLDVFLVRADLLCDFPKVDRFRSMTVLVLHEDRVTLHFTTSAKEKWVVDYV